MRLLAPNVGWVLEGENLYWTTDHGLKWVDITPRGASFSGARNVGVFFLDTSNGWVLLTHWDQSLRDWRLEIAKTSDGGASWSIAPLSYPDLSPALRDAMAGPAGMCFADPLHGWIDMAFAGNSKSGRLLATKDGGKTWIWLDTPVVAGDIYFTTTKDGWLNGGADFKLYVTHDGGENWREVTITPPPQVGAATDSTYHLPVFIDAQYGFTAVNYSGVHGPPPKFVLFATDDGGRTWEPRRILEEIGEPSIGSQIPFSITDSVVFLPTAAAVSTGTVASVPLGRGLNSDTVVSPSGTLEISFADRIHGWLLRTDGSIMSTTDGGAKWTRTAPRSQSSPLKGGEAFDKAAIDNVASPAFADSQDIGAAPGGPDFHTSLHLGFDISYVMTESEMNTWWTKSPYYDASIYLPGSANRGVDRNLTSRWVKAVTTQGWGLIPIWFGRQAPCTLCSNCSSKFSSDPATARSDGETEASNAENAAGKLGLRATAIYKDLENYDAANNACSAAVREYLGGWVSKNYRTFYLERTGSLGRQRK